MCTPSVSVLLVQLKAGEPHAVVSVAGGLVAEGRPLEVQHFGFQLLQHLVRHAPASQSARKRHHTSVQLSSSSRGAVVTAPPRRPGR